MVNGQIVDGSEKKTVHLSHPASTTDRDCITMAVKNNFWKSFNMFIANFGQLYCCIQVKLFRQFRGVPRIWEGGGQEFFFQIWKFACSPCALLGGFGGMLPRENFFKRCNLVRLRVYFDQILSLFFFQKLLFFI